MYLPLSVRLFVHSFFFALKVEALRNSFADVHTEFVTERIRDRDTRNVECGLLEGYIDQLCSSVADLQNRLARLEEQFRSFQNERR